MEMRIFAVFTGLWMVTAAYAAGPTLEIGATGSDTDYQQEQAMARGDDGSSLPLKDNPKTKFLGRRPS